MRQDQGTAAARMAVAVSAACLLAASFLAVRVLASAILAASPAAAQETEPSIDRWAAHDAARFRYPDGVMRVSAHSWWPKSDVDYVDFVLQLDFRAATPDSEGVVIVRAWDRREASSGYRIALADPIPGAKAVGAVGLRANKKKSAAPNSAALLTVAKGQAGEWHRLEVRCDGDRVSVVLDGVVINVVDGSDPLAGYVGLEVSRGALEFRGVRVLQLTGGVFSCRERPLAAGVPGSGTAGLTLPRLLFEEKPRYTPEAMRRIVQGKVSLEAVVGIDGRVESMCVARSLDPALDAQAVGAARRWRFAAARMNGEPVRAAVRIEMEFTLK